MEKNIQVTSHTPVNQALVYAGIWFAVIAWGTSFVAARTLLHGWCRFSLEMIFLPSSIQTPEADLYVLYF